MAMFRVPLPLLLPLVDTALANDKPPLPIGLYRQPLTPRRHEAATPDDLFLARHEGGSVPVRVKPER
jgi:hypothetical protein